MEFPQFLNGVKIVELATYAAAPAATRLLADWGADVIKIEGPGPDPMRAFSASTCGTPTPEENPIYQFENANKRGIALNLKNPEGMAVLHRLLEDADVFVTNTRIQSLSRLGLDYETLHARYPRLIWGHVSGLGTEGPEAHKPGFDITAFWSRSGALLDVAQPDSPPNTSPYGAGDHTLALGFAAGIMGALLKQRATGEGDRVAISLIGAAAWAYAMVIVSTQYVDVWPKSRLKPGHPLNASYRCADGEWFMSTVIEYERYFATVCSIMGLDHLIDDERYSTFEGVVEGEHRTELVKLLDEKFAQHDRPYWQEQFERNDVPCEGIRHFKDVSQDPQAWANGNLVQFTFENGHQAAIPASPVQFSEKVAPPCARAPHFGEHNAEVLKGVGYTDDQIRAMAESGAIFSR